jgi:hypothetical protein
MSDLKSVLERGLRGFEPSDDAFERTLRRRNRKRRNQRIAAGVVGMAVFVASVWIVTSEGWLDRGETSVVPGTDVTGPTAETGPADTGPTETAPPSAPASAAPDVVERATCSDGARWRLEVTDIGDQIKVRFEVHQSPVGHSWRIQLSHMERNILPCCGHVFFDGTRVAGDGGDLVVQVARPDWVPHNHGVRGKAVDRQTRQVCRVFVWYR